LRLYPFLQSAIQTGKAPVTPLTPCRRLSCGCDGRARRPGYNRRMHPIAVIALLASSLSSLSAQTATDLQRVYRERYAARLQPMLCEVVRFRTEAGNVDAHAQQRRWIEHRVKDQGAFGRAGGRVQSRARRHD
jgi:hypothetical protein